MNFYPINRHTRHLGTCRLPAVNANKHLEERMEILLDRYRKIAKGEIDDDLIDHRVETLRKVSKLENPNPTDVAKEMIIPSKYNRDALDLMISQIQWLSEVTENVNEPKSFEMHSTDWNGQPQKENYEFFKCITDFDNLRSIVSDFKELLSAVNKSNNEESLSVFDMARCVEIYRSIGNAILVQYYPDQVNNSLQEIQTLLKNDQDVKVEIFTNINLSKSNYFIESYPIRNLLFSLGVTNEDVMIKEIVLGFDRIALTKFTEQLDADGIERTSDFFTIHDREHHKSMGSQKLDYEKSSSGKVSFKFQLCRYLEEHTKSISVFKDLNAYMKENLSDRLQQNWKVFQIILLHEVYLSNITTISYMLSLAKLIPDKFMEMQLFFGKKRKPIHSIINDFAIGEFRSVKAYRDFIKNFSELLNFRQETSKLYLWSELNLRLTLYRLSPSNFIRQYVWQDLISITGQGEKICHSRKKNFGSMAPWIDKEQDRRESVIRKILENDFELFAEKLLELSAAYSYSSLDGMTKKPTKKTQST